MDQNNSPQKALESPSDDLEREVASVYERHFAELLAYAATVTRSGDGTADAVQEAFLRYFVERSYGRSVDNPRAWLFRVIHNYLLDRMDAAATRREILSQDSDEMPDQNHGPEAMLRHAQMADEISSLLTPREVECLSLRAQGMSYAEIAHELGVRSGTVSSLLTRVHIRLREAAGNNQTFRWSAAEALCYLFRRGEGYSS